MDRNRFTKQQSGVWGAIFLMATSAIGPGFLTQTALFTEHLRANFGSIILLSTLLDLVIQGTIWRVITYAGVPASKLLDQWFMYAGYVLTGAVVIGGLVFNIGNLGGSGLGLQAIFPNIPSSMGSGLSAILVFLLLFRPAWRPLLDFWTVSLGMLFLGIVGWGLWQVSVPWPVMVARTFWPTEFNAFATVTLVGGTVGGYISFVGAHRLIESGHIGPAAQPLVWRSAISGILMTSIVRFSLFALFLGLLDADAQRTWASSANPVGQAFSYITSHAAFFGLVLWSASITSAVGATYTSFSFIRSYLPKAENPVFMAGFLLLSWFILVFWGKPAHLLVLAGTINALVLPFGLAGILWVGQKRQIPFHALFRWIGWGVVLLFLGLFIESFLKF